MQDGILSIATGLKTKSKVWKNERLAWSALVERLKKPVVTGETLKQFLAASKAERSSIKDVGGYVGGYLRGGRRKPQNVAHRQILTLDLDYAHADFWEDFKLFFDCAAVLHATHSHTPASPRLRLIIPVNRELQADEYVAVSRQVAGILNIELFDNTTFEVNRLMYWPSVSKDVEYYVRVQKGEFLDADEILEMYADWTDASLWPTSVRHVKAVKDAAAKQQDPEEKKGIVGAFCRTFTISEAIEAFLGEVYEEVNEHCYTYLSGSTAAGLKVYENKFAFSHHGTDPAGGKLCNAFDLVRLHLFGHLDPEDAHEDAEGGRKSYAAMEELARANEAVRRTLAAENLAESRYDFKEDYEDEDDAENNVQGQENLEWATALEVDGKGNYLSTSNNLNLIFANDARLKGAFKYNAFDAKRYVFKSLPWRKIDKPDVIKNVDYAGIRNYIEGVYGIVSQLKIDDALSLEFEKHSFHPVQSYLNSLTWDGEKRIDTLLVDYFGCDDTIYHREAIRKTLVGAVARVFQAGIKFDLVLVLVGSQGTGKSTFVNRLGNGWASDSFLTVHGKESFEQLQGAWLIEMAELSGLRKAETETIKHFISKQFDTFRPAYARTPETFPRQCVFIGTTNNAAFLTDPTGNRRFMPVDIVEERVTKDVFKLTEDEVGQIWAEAVELYIEGEPLYLSDKANVLAAVQQQEHSLQDERNGLIEKYLETPLPAKWDAMDIYERRAYYTDPIAPRNGLETRLFVCVAEIWCECLGKEKEDMDRYKTREINEYLKSLDDWQEMKTTKNFKLYGKQKYYARKLF